MSQFRLDKIPCGHILRNGRACPGNRRHKLTHDVNCPFFARSSNIPKN